MSGPSSKGIFWNFSKLHNYVLRRYGRFYVHRSSQKRSFWNLKIYCLYRGLILPPTLSTSGWKGYPKVFVDTLPTLAILLWSWMCVLILNPSKWRSFPFAHDYASVPITLGTPKFQELASRPQSNCRNFSNFHNFI